MKHIGIRSILVIASLLVPAAVCADGVTFVRGSFAAGAERDAATDEAALRAARRIFYVFEMNNPGDPAPVRVQWTYDGRPLPAQTLEAGHSPHWRLWSIIPRRAVGHTIEVNLLDAAGASLHTERLELH